ncbi:Putative HTH-type transcriptional regulator [Thermoflexales bacterium]|nr:Putative HTH-type transcriptional regulator [Thermoflexales bacterium]
MPDLDRFAAWLKHRRIALNLTREELAKRAHCSASALRRLEAGDLRASEQLAASLAKALGVASDQTGAFTRFARGEAVEAELFDLPSGAVVSSAFDRSATPHNLPAPLTSLIGRKRDIDTIGELLQEPGVRLLTLTGPPGTGKTRLSIAAAQQLIGTTALFPDGVWFVPLAPIAEPALVADTIAQVLGVQGTTGEVALFLREFLRAKRLLLVLDNFEQLTQAASLITDLLTNAPQLKAMVTSRAVLHVYGEHEYPVLPLALPDVQRLPTAQALSFYTRFASVQLFKDRARAVKPDFQLTLENAADVARVCAWLDGLPLAIEMAAAQVKWLPLPKLLEQLSDRLTTLTGGPIDLSPRQQSLTGAIDWSFDLLDHEEQQLFSLLSVFVDGCAEEALIDLAAAGAWSIPNPATKARDLAEKSLLRYELTPGDQERYIMLESIREYAQNRLERMGLADAVQRWHAQYFQQLTQIAAWELNEVNHEIWLRRCELELNNFRAALRWCVRHAPEIGVLLAANLCDFWYLRGLLTEGRAWLDELLDKSESRSSDLLIQALLAAGTLAVHQGDLTHTILAANEALRLSRASGDQNGIARALHCLGNVALYQSHYAQAEAFYAEALPLFMARGPRAYAAQVMNNLGLVAKDRSNFPRAIQYFENSLALRRTIDHKRGMAQSLLNLANAAYWQGDYDRTAELATQALELSRSTGYTLNVSYALESLGMTLLKQQQFERARAALNESATLFTELGDKKGMALILIDLGALARAQGHWAEATQLYRRSLKLCVQIGERRRLAFGLEGLALVACSQASYAHAVTLLSAVRALRSQAGIPLPASEQDEIDQALAQARDVLGRAAFEAAWTQGGAMLLDEVVKLAIGEER